MSRSSVPLGNLLIFGGLIAFAAIARLLPHPPNVAAVAATALFAGWFFRSRLIAAGAPIGAMLVSDSIIGGYHPGVMFVVYGSLVAPIFLRRFMGDGTSLRRLFGGAVVGSLAGSVLFFVTTNLAVWAYSGYYTRTLAGLVECYAAAVPFFKYTAAGDLAYAVTIFGAYTLIRGIGFRPMRVAQRPAFARA